MLQLLAPFWHSHSMVWTVTVIDTIWCQLLALLLQLLAHWFTNRVYALSLDAAENNTYITGWTVVQTSSPVLTATCLSNGSLCDFLTFFPNRPGGHTPRPVLTQNGSNDVDSRKDVPFGIKIATFLNPWPSDPQNRQNLPNFGWDRKFSLDFAFNIGVSRVNTPYSSSEPNKSAIVNRQCGDGKFKYVPKFCLGGTGHVMSRMRRDNLHWTGTLEPNISKRAGDRGLVTMEHQ